MTAEGWTIAEACERFEAAGMPVAGGPARFRELVNVLGIEPVGETRKPAGSKGGRGYLRYPIGELQHAHGRNAEWLVRARRRAPRVPASGDT